MVGVIIVAEKILKSQGEIIERKVQTKRNMDSESICLHNME